MGSFLRRYYPAVRKPPEAGKGSGLRATISREHLPSCLAELYLCLRICSYEHLSTASLFILTFVACSSCVSIRRTIRFKRTSVSINEYTVNAWPTTGQLQQRPCISLGIRWLLLPTLLARSNHVRVSRGSRSSKPEALNPNPYS